MKMSIITDVATLVKAGLTIEDIKDIIKADKEGTIQNNPKDPDPKDPDPKDPDPKDPDPKDPDPEPDYKALYMKSQEDLKKLQGDNTRKNIQPDPIDREKLFKGIKNRL